MKRIFAILMVLTLMGATAVFAEGQGESAAEKPFPSKPVNMIVGYNPGGGTDTPARALAAAAPEFMNNQPLIVVNKPGASGMLGPKFVAEQKADGYTLLMGWGNTEFTFNRHVRELPIKVFDDFEPVMAVIKYSSCIAVPTSSPIKSLDDFVAAAKDNPGKLQWTHTGVGGEHYVNALDFFDRAGIELTEVPNTGGVKTRNLVAGEHVDVAVFATFLAAGFEDKVRVIAIFTDDPNHMFPDVKTANEQGYESINAYAIKCIAAPAGTPKERIDILYDSMKKALEHPAAQKIMKQNNFTPLGWGPDETLKAVKDLDAKYKALIDKLGLAK